MIRRTILLGFVLLAPVAARAEGSVGWTRDGRYLVVDQDIGASEGTIARLTVDLWTGEIAKDKFDWNNCMTGDPSDEGAEDAAQCRKEQEDLRESWDAKTAPFDKAHPQDGADSSFDGPGGATLEVLAGKPIAPEDGVAKLPKGTVVFRAAVKGKATHEAKAPAGCSEARAFWSSDGQRVVVLCGDPEYDLIQDALLIAGTPQVDLLDAGSGRAPALAASLTKAGYAPAHQGKSRDPHDATEIYAAKGYEPEALQIAGAIGAPKGAVKPLTWPTRYAITVVAAKK